jgi:hypothetical protein
VRRQALPQLPAGQAGSHPNPLPCPDPRAPLRILVILIPVLVILNSSEELSAALLAVACCLSSLAKPRACYFPLFPSSLVPLSLCPSTPTPKPLPITTVTAVTEYAFPLRDTQKRHHGSRDSTTAPLEPGTRASRGKGKPQLNSFMCRVTSSRAATDLQRRLLVLSLLGSDLLPHPGKHP